ncbi:MAG: protein kinase, partial [Planctomycetota bacterium]
MSAENEKRETDKSERSPWIQRAGPTPGGGPSPWAPPGRPGSGRTDATPVTESRLERIQKLGEGGYGEVWLVKYLGALEAHKHLNKRAGAQKNAFREAVNTRAVNHPNVVKVVDVFEDADGPVLRMEYVDGTDLGHQVMEDGIFPVERVLPIGIQIADALQATHERGIVHLDLKPSNVILRKDGQSVVVTDFGISGALRVSEGKQAVGKGGTPYFMAPELHQANGTGTPSSDIWSLGVTLYWLLSGSFPFAFDTKDPGEAVLEPPRDLTQSHRYVSAEFWALLRRMLSRDVERRPGSMADVRRGFEACAYELTCPACTRSFRVETISGVCPESRCQDPRVVTLKAALLARRGAETALAECRFSEAGRGFEKAGSEFRSLEGFEESVTWTESLVRAIPGLAKDHDDLIASAETLLENERYLDCVAKMHEARYRYSRSPALMKLRAALRARLAELHKATPELVKELTRRREFDEAREQLTRIDHILANERARAELEFGLAAAGEEVKEFRWLYQEVDRQQDAFKNWTQAGKDALADFAFKKAFDAYSSLERDFSAEEYERLLAALATAETKYDKATMFDDEFLRALVHDPTVGDRVERLHLDEARQACASLIEDFPVEEHPCFQPIAERRKAYEQAANAVRRHVEENLEKCAGARKKRKVFEELERLDKFKDLVLRSDLFDAKVRESVTDRHRACSQAVEEIRTHYREGKQAFERREFAPAQHALRLVEAMAPGGYEDVPEMLQEIDERIHEIQALKAQVAEHFGHIERGYLGLE